MWKVAVLACLVALCAAQEPAKPILAETFDAHADLREYRHEGPGHTMEYKGTARLGRAPAMKEAVDIQEVVNDRGMRETFEHLERRDMMEDYFFESDGTTTHCEKEKTMTNEIYPFWGWLKDAHFAGKRQLMNNRTVDIWRGQEGGLRFEVGVGEMDANMPYFLYREGRRGEQHFEFTMFMAETPPSTLFTIPKACMT